MSQQSHAQSHAEETESIFESQPLMIDAETQTSSPTDNLAVEGAAESTPVASFRDDAGFVRRAITSMHTQVNDLM